MVRHFRYAGAAGLVLTALAGCATGPSSEMTSQASATSTPPQAPQSTTGSTPTIPMPNTSPPAEVDCGLSTLLDDIDLVGVGQLAIDGGVATSFDRYWGAELSYWTVQFTPREIYLNSSDIAVSVGTDVSSMLLDSTAYGPDDEISYRLFDPAELSGDRDVIALFEEFPLDAGDSELRLRQVIEYTQESSFIDGVCGEQLNNELTILQQADQLTTVELLTKWVSALQASVTAESELADLIESERRDTYLDEYSEAWSRTEPNERSLRPSDVPEHVRANLDVAALVLEVTNLRDDEVLVIHTSSGVSGSIHGDALPAIQPAFFTPNDTHITISIGTAPWGENAIDIARIDIGERTGIHGFRVVGTRQSIELEALDAATVASVLNVSANELAQLRSRLLAGSVELPG